MPSKSTISLPLAASAGTCGRRTARRAARRCAWDLRSPSIQPSFWRRAVHPMIYVGGFCISVEVELVQQTFEHSFTLCGERLLRVPQAEKYSFWSTAQTRDPCGKRPFLLRPGWSQFDLCRWRSRPHGANSGERILRAGGDGLNVAARHQPAFQVARVGNGDAPNLSVMPDHFENFNVRARRRNGRKFFTDWSRSALGNERRSPSIARSAAWLRVQSRP